jgi:hypothetical protein
VICCNWLFVLVSSVLLLALATATAVAPRGHSYWMQAPLLHQLCRLISLRTSQLAGIVRFGTLSNKIDLQPDIDPFILQKKRKKDEKGEYVKCISNDEKKQNEQLLALFYGSDVFRPSFLDTDNKM